MLKRICQKISPINPLSANTTIWSNTPKQFVGKLSSDFLSLFDNFVGLALKRIILIRKKHKSQLIVANILAYNSANFSINFSYSIVFYSRLYPRRYRENTPENRKWWWLHIYVAFNKRKFSFQDFLGKFEQRPKAVHQRCS